jgi:hypothetical protein
MPHLRLLPLACLPLLIPTGCRDRALQQRTEQIREFSDREDRAYRAEAVAQIEHTYWTIQDHTWYGKAPDGTVIQLNGPLLIPAPLPSSAFYRGWHLQLTLIAEDWRTYPAEKHTKPLTIVYGLTRANAKDWVIRVTDGVITTPVHGPEAAAVRAEEAAR